MANVDVTQALSLVKARLNRIQEDTSLDDYLTARINAVIGELEATGIALTNSTKDLLQVVDSTCWAYSNRDKPDGMPEWLRLRRRERWLNERMREAGE